MNQGKNILNVLLLEVKIVTPSLDRESTEILHKILEIK